MKGNASQNLSSLEDIRLLVKSANQQFEDLIVYSELTWSVRMLKAHLSQVHPSNPAVPEQKLIYSGQLLSDELILKDIIRSYKDVETENHIFHLVYQPKMSATKPKTQQPLSQSEEQQKKLPSSSTESNSTDGLRHRNVTTSAASNATSATAGVTASSTTPTTTTSTATTTPTATTNQVPQQTPNITINPFNIPQMAGAAAAGCSNGAPNSNYQYPSYITFTFPGQFTPEMVAQHQPDVYNWVQQIYNSYIEQCLRMANLTVNPAQVPTQAESVPLLVPPPAFLTQNIPQAPQAAAPPTNSQTATGSTEATTAGPSSSSTPTVELDGPSTSRASAARFAPRIVPVKPGVAQPQASPSTAATSVPPAPATAPSPTAAAGPAPAPATAPAPGPAPAPAENAERAQPRFPNIVQEEQDNRDWLDVFYSVTRLLAFLTIVYFYSSPLRCLVVAIIAVGIYLYHIGFFQTLRITRSTNQNNNNNQNVNDNNAAAPPAAENAAQAEEQNPLNPPPSPDTAAAESIPNLAPSSEHVTSSVTPPEAEPSATSLIAFVRTFVVSFFASLLPETPAL